MSGKTKKSGDIAKIYATLVGRVDNAITVLERMTEQQTFDWFHIAQVTELLKNALLEAEEAYIEADEQADHGLILLPHSAKRHIEDPQ